MRESEIEEFEKRFIALAKKDMNKARELFRETFAVTCFACGHQGKTVPPLNCAKCGTYLD
jgi:hypothetical protein